MKGRGADRKIAQAGAGGAPDGARLHALKRAFHARNQGNAAAVDNLWTTAGRMAGLAQLGAALRMLAHRIRIARQTFDLIVARVDN
jgi:hypothetical protein